MSFTVGPDALSVTDNVTGLMYQREDDNITRSWADAIAYCENLVLPSGGYSDWRLPDQYELQSIVNYGSSDPAIDTEAFLGTNSSSGSFYWSSSVLASYPLYAWLISFRTGDVGFLYKAERYYVRCVRGAPLPHSFTDNGNGTVSDKDTGLMWQRCPAGLSGTECSVGTAEARSWESALDYCEDLDLAEHEDWRLPDIKEMRSIVDNTRFNPTIDPEAFPGVDSSHYWSSSTKAYRTHDAWQVWFFNGTMFFDQKDKTYAYHVRCVR